MRTFFALLAAAIGFVLVWAVAGPAGAQDDINIPPSSSGSGTPGSIVEIFREPVPDELVGQTCDVDFIAANNASVHPDNNLILTTGSDSVTFFDVEGTSDQITQSQEEVVLGSEVVLELEFGPDGLTSGGLDITFDCEAQPPVTTTAPPTTAPPTTLPAAVPDTAVPAQPSFTG